ncbi:ATP-binding protein [Allosphingosinicella deserti]|uniref:histidine kinase n=1 Tax=Allosphingosinicella deserti TaxID=2116704 RepID=A0A2P7QW40_9SPHN|nr:ATP-binding protein [Sphingomonas deserti]PSJ42164.1 histidine kinase [Sphingomonas deserti]
MTPLVGRATTKLIMVAFMLTAGPSLAQEGRLQTASSSSYDKQLEAAKQAMMADPERALNLARRALPLLSRVPEGQERRVAEARAQWLEGEALGRMGRSDEAASVLDKGLATVRALAPSAKLHGDLLMSRAATSADVGQVRPALEGYQAAFRIFQRLGDDRSQAMALQNIGALYSNAGDNERVLKYYDQSADIYQGDPAVVLAAHNNIGTAYRDMGRLPEAEQEFRRALALSRKMESPLLEARVLTNIAATQLLAGRLRSADSTADAGIRVAAHGAAAEWAPFLWGVKAQIAEKHGDRGAAAQYLERTFEGANLEETNPFFRDFHDTAQRVYAALGNQQAALAHLRALKRIDDETREIRTSTNAALMAAQFDFSNQELKISRLKTGQLERDIALAKSRGRVQVILLASIALALALVIAAYLSIRRSRNKVRAANADLSQSNLALEKALRAKSEFLATTSHEIRTPLNGILGMTQVLLADRTIIGETKGRVEVVHSAGEMMKAVVDDILDMAKIESGRIEIVAETVFLRKLVSDVSRIWTDQAQEKGLTVALDLQRAPEVIIEDGRRLKQVVFNLISNAVKFTDAGTISIEAAADEVEGVLKIVVRDSGIGIPEHQLEAVFEAFHQVDGRTTRKFSGTGLGLAISKNLVEAMGGTITVQSELGIGTTFSVHLPLRLPVTADVPDTNAGTGDLTLDRCAVLILEPNMLLQSITAAALDSAVAELVFADDANAAIELLGRRGFDIIVLDAAALGDVPTEDAKRLCPAAKIVLMGADAAMSPGANTIAGVDAIAIKAFPPINLAQILEDVVGGDVVAKVKTVKAAA